jgi:hypothetical protein
VSSTSASSGSGRSPFQTSGLAWPRAGTKDKEGYPIDDNLVPRQVKVAVAVLAEHLVAGNPDVVDTGQQEDDQGGRGGTGVRPTHHDPQVAGRGRSDHQGLGYGTFGRGGPKRIIKH